MLRRTCLVAASKSSGTSSMYQARPPKRKPKQFHVYLGKGVSKREYIREQRSTYTVAYERMPQYLPGRNTYMNPKTLTISPGVDGIVLRQDSVINPETRRWLHVEPDVQKVVRSKSISNHFIKTNMLSPMNHKNRAYQSEMYDVTHPDWRVKVQREPPLTERFADVNTFTRGIVTKLKPRSKYVYI